MPSRSSIRTSRLVLAPVSAADLSGLMALKADPRVYALMLGGVRSHFDTVRELAEEIAYWGANGVGLFSIYEGASFQGVTGIHDRPDGRGKALRFAVWPDARGRGIAREAAAAALRFAHEDAGLERIIAVARSENFGSRMVLGSIGMHECDAFLRDGHVMMVYESVWRRRRYVV
jgi:RimJ/RimL family protein N-acetyltransferase